MCNSIPSHNLYNLKTNPFAPELEKELSPNKKEELTLYAKVEGFGNQVLHIDNWFTNSKNLAKNNCILVYGFDGSGRTSVVNYILWRFCEGKKIDIDQITLVKTVVRNDHNIEPIQDLLKNLCSYLSKSLGRKFTEEYYGLEKDYKEQVLYNREPANRKSL